MGSEKRYLDGPGFIAWLGSERDIFHEKSVQGVPAGRFRGDLFSGDEPTRALNRWRKGSSVDTLNRGRAFESVMESLNLQVWEIPDHLWRDRRNHRGRPDYQRVRLLSNCGLSQRRIARILGCSDSTVNATLMGGDELW